MNILFLHNNYPAQFFHIARFFAASQENTVVFLSLFRRQDMKIEGVQHLQIHLPAHSKSGNRAEQALLQHLHTGEAFGNAMLKLKKSGFIPDLIYDHPGWGCSVYTQDIFPQAARVCYCEWFYTKDADFSFFSKGKTRPAIDFAANRQRNLYQLDALRECDMAITPTAWQHSQYPVEYAHKIRILHDGIDTRFFSPLNGDEKKESIIGGLDISAFPEIVTYATRGLEPYRGFPQFFRSIPAILKARSKCHVVIMANDQASYSSRRSDGMTWKEAMLKEVSVDMERVHFLPFGSYADYRNLLRASSVHVYMTVPFVVSWSLLEAMSCRCAVVASDTAPVTEIIKHRKNGILVSFWEYNKLSQAIIEVLKNRPQHKEICTEARKTICDRYELDKLVPQHLYLLIDAVRKKQMVLTKE